MLFGAPDLSFTQFMVEILAVVIFALVMTRLRLDARDLREFEDLLRDGGLAVLGGTGVVLVLLKVLEVPLDNRLSVFFAEHSASVAHGRNIVNVILVDFRGLDTLGEISVIMGAGIAILALLRRADSRRSRLGKLPPSGEVAA
jgi:multicomponent Na+:H+ antiporter subunit A